MFDLYLFNTIINVLWYLFTILFVLYEYTTFFSYIYNFVRFCGKLVSGVSQIYKYINYTRPSSIDIESQNLQEDQNTRKSIYTRCKNYITKNYNYYYRKIYSCDTFNEDVVRQQGTTRIPLVETDYSSQIKLSTQLSQSNQSNNNYYDSQGTFNEDVVRRQGTFNEDVVRRQGNEKNIKECELKLFNQKMKELEDSEFKINSELEDLELKERSYSYNYSPLSLDDKDDFLFNKNFKTNYIISNELSNSFLKKKVSFNEKINKYNSDSSSDINDSDINDSDIDSNIDLDSI